MMAGSILWPVWPEFVKGYKHPELLLAIGTALFIGTQLFTAPLLGKLSDVYGRRPIFIISAAGTFLANLLLLPRNAFAYFSNRGADGLTNGVYSAVRSAITDISPRQDLMKNMGLEGTIVSLGFVLGPLLAAGVLLGLKVEPASASAVLVTTGVSISFLNILLSLIFRETLTNKISLTRGEVPRLFRDAINLPGHLRRIITLDKQRPGLRNVVALQLFLTMSLGYYNYLITYISLGGLRLSPKEISYFFVYFGVVFLIVSYGFFTHWVDKVDARRFVMATAALGIAAHVGYAFVGSAVLALYIIVTIDCLTISLLPGVMDGLLARYTQDDDRGELFGITQALNGIASLLTTAVFGGLSVISLSLPFYWFAFCLVPLLWAPRLITVRRDLVVTGQ